MRRALRLLLVCVVAAAIAVPPSSLGAVTTLTTWNAYVTDVDDGDTFNADLDGDGYPDDPRIRITGIQAMELTDYSHTDPDGPCMGPEAARRLMSLVEDKDVALSAVDAGSTGSHDRPQRFVEVGDAGTTVDAGLTMLREGLALWSSNGTEWVRNQEYYLAAKAARAAGVGIWNPTYTGGRCAYGPAQDAKLDMWIQWDADGPDGTNVNGEWIRIRNAGGTAVDLSGWKFRDPSLTTAGVKAEYTFPAGAAIPARRSIQLKVGTGQDTDDRLYFWGQEKPKFENVDYARSIGDGGYLFDPDGSLRASFMYPCMPRGECSDPLRGALKVKANYNPDGPDLPGEYIDVKNVSARTVRLEKYQLEVWPFGYAFARTDALKPGQVLRLWVKRGKNGKDGAGRLVRYWGFTDGAILNNNGDWARVKTFEDVQAACHAWGGKRCGVTG